MKYIGDRLYSDPEKAARRLMEHARTFEPIQDGRIYIEKINYPVLDEDKATPAEYWAGLQYAKRSGLARVPRERHVREDAAGWERPVHLKRSGLSEVVQAEAQLSL
ncbi:MULTISPECIES: hypothetical protein [Bradyrhizobium]